MTRARALRRTATTVVVLLGVLACQSLTTANAGVQAVRPGTQAVSSGSFAVVPVVTGSTPTTGALTLNYGALTPPPQYFEVVNTGSLTLTAASYGVVVTGGGVGTPTIALSACVGASWNTVLGTCTGTTTAIGSWTPASSAIIASAAVPAASAARLHIKATLTGGVGATASAVISTVVTSQSPRQVRATTTTNS